MRSNVKLGSVSGIEIGLPHSWFIIAALIVFSLVGHFRQMDQNGSASKTWNAFLTAALFFVSFLLHELAHSRVAEKQGLKVSATTLFALGGVSQIPDNATDAKSEHWVSIAGPITGLVIGFVCLGTALGLGWQLSTQPKTAATGVGVLVSLGYINIALATFNMIPAFPLDGSRVLYSIVWAATKDPARSKRIKARIRQVVAFLFILDGIWKFFSGAGCGGLCIAFIGWFLLDAAGASYPHVRETTTATAIAAVQVCEMMSRGWRVVDRGMSLQDFLDSYLLKTAQRCFAGEDRGALVGLITRGAVAVIPRDRWHRTSSPSCCGLAPGRDFPAQTGRYKFTVAKWVGKVHGRVSGESTEGFLTVKCPRSWSKQTLSLEVRYG
jgi:Zn-dependent protease